MCNACGFFCCAYDGFSGCGCDHCPEPACHPRCGTCRKPDEECECDDLDDADDRDFEAFLGDR